MEGITQEKQIISFISIVVSSKRNLGTIRSKIDAVSLEKMNINLYWGYLRILTSNIITLWIVERLI